MKKILLFATAATIILGGCATQGKNSIDYQANTPVTYKNEVTINKPHTVVWDELVKELSKSFYVINNIDKASRIINITFSSTTPTEYVDCGKTTRTYTQGEKVETWAYDVAGPAIYKVAGDRQQNVANATYAMVTRTPSLDGRANIYLAPTQAKADATMVTVNSRYILTVAMRAEAFSEHFSGNTFSRGTVPIDSAIWSFSTNKPEKFDIGTGQPPVTCFSKGKFESEILKMIGQ